MGELDSIKLNFDANGLMALNISLAVVMFGVALGIKAEDFKTLFAQPKLLFVGLFSQFLVLPLLSFLLILILKPSASIALGMILVASCPGGNISNFMSHLAKANTALSISLTAFSTVLCIFLTPLNLEIWGNLYPPSQEILREIHLNFWDLLKTIILILGLPLALGLWIRHKQNKLALSLSKILKPLSILIFVAIVVMAFSKNTDIFKTHIHHVLLLVLVHNGIALGSGYLLASLFKLDYKSKKTIALETGIQNSGLGLLLIFAFFDGLGGMAILAAWWGIWHIISGLSISLFWAAKNNSKAIE